jgi:hypothetical protein
LVGGFLFSKVKTGDRNKNKNNKPGGDRVHVCDGFEVGSYGCGTCSLAPVGFWEKMPLLLLAKKS